MKHMRKIFALMLAVVMTLAMSVTVFAENFNITLPAATGLTKTGGTVTYDIYQILTGDYTTDGTTETLSNVHWGANTAKSGALVTATEMAALEGLTDDDPATARTLYTNYVTGTAFKADQAAESVVSVPSGYYLIKEKITNPNDGVEESLYVVEVAGTVTMTRKAGTTSSDKKLDDKNDSDPTDAATNATMGTSSDYDIGDEVPYHVTATISSEVGNYPKYHITLEDILESGKFDSITLNKSTITLDGAAIADTADYEVRATWDAEPTKDGFKVTYEFTPKADKDLSSLAGKQIAIDFTAKLGEGAAIGEEGNKNTLKVAYSNNPNESDGHSEGTTPDKEVITFTYKVVVDKYDDQSAPLENAGFTLYKVSKTDAEAGVPAASATDAATKNAYWATKAIQTWTTTAKEGKTAGKNNRFSFEGIDDGYYVLCETTTPTGYNTLDPQVFTVTATHGGTDGLTLTDLSGDKVSGDITFTKDVAAGSLSADVTNNKGTTLPETGGIGTTMFYVIGAILVVGAGIILVTRRRMNVQ